MARLRRRGQYRHREVRVMRVPMSRRVLLRAATAGWLLLGSKAQGPAIPRATATALPARGAKVDAGTALFTRYGGELGGSQPKKPG